MSMGKTPQSEACERDTPLAQPQMKSENNQPLLDNSKRFSTTNLFITTGPHLAVRYRGHPHHPVVRHQLPQTVPFRRRTPNGQQSLVLTVLAKVLRKGEPVRPGENPDKASSSKLGVKAPEKVVEKMSVVDEELGVHEDSDPGHKGVTHHRLSVCKGGGWK